MTKSNFFFLDQCDIFLSERSDRVESGGHMEGEKSYDREPRGSDLHVRRDLTLAETGKFSIGENSAFHPK